MLCFESQTMQWYYHFLARRPYVVVFSIGVICMSCIALSLLENDLPNFSDPTLGFETRGTELGKRLTAWYNLQHETGSSGTLVADPNELIFRRKLNAPNAPAGHKHKHNQRRKHKKKHRKAQVNATEKDPHIEYDYKKRYNAKQQQVKLSTTPTSTATQLPQNDAWVGDSGIIRDYEPLSDSTIENEREHNFAYGHNTTSINVRLQSDKAQTKKSTWRLLKQAASLPTMTWHSNTLTSDERQLTEGYFCDSPYKEFSHFVVKRIGPNATDTLFDLNSLLAMCQLQEQITAVYNYEEYCQRETLNDNCCRPWSLPNYAVLYANKSSCFDLTLDDVNGLQSLLLTCFKYYNNLKLGNDCNEHNLCNAPNECLRHNLVYNILQFITDYNFIRLNDTNVYLRYAMIFVPVVHSAKILPLFHKWEEAELKNELVQVVAMDLGLENELFNELLLTDVWLVSLGGIFVMACMWLYTNSLLITLMSCLAVAFSLGLAYFLYTLVFEFEFFPYMNLLAVVVIIGIGADDVFLFVKIWHCVLGERFNKSTAIAAPSTFEEVERSESLENIMSLTMRHAAASMFVTSLTTAGAFYASYISSITAIKCFGVFAGTVVITNYLLMITWLPATVAIIERIMANSKTCIQLQMQTIILACNKSINKFCQLFEKAIIDSIMNYAYFWLMLFGAIGISSTAIVLYWPGLQLPENSHFQLFESQHPFEVYSAHLKNEFWFEKSLSSFENFKMPLRFVWGIHPADDGDYTNPNSHGNLYYDNNFNITTEAAQIWLFNFCHNIRQQPFYQRTFGFLLPNCFIDNFIDFMKRRCIDGMDDTDRTPCCNERFPFDPHIFEICLPQSISNLYATPREYFLPGVAGPKFAAVPMPTSMQNINADSAEYSEKLNNSMESPAYAAAAANVPQVQVKALVIEFESNVSYSTIYDNVKTFYETVEKWFQQQLRNAPAELKNGWFISELKFYNVQDTLLRDTLVAITLAMTASLVVLLFITLNVLVSIFAVITVLFSILTTVSVLILLGWKLNILESIAVSTAIGLAVDFSLHYGLHYRLSKAKERIGATHFAMTRIIGPTVMAAVTTGFAGGIMMASNILPYIQIGIFLVVVMIVSWFYATFFLMSLLKVAGPEYGFMQLKLPRFSKRGTSNGTKYFEREPNQVNASEQLLTPSSSAIGELHNSETHELESLNSSSLIKTICGNDYEHSFQTEQPKYRNTTTAQTNTPSLKTPTPTTKTVSALSSKSKSKSSTLASSSASSSTSSSSRSTNSKSANILVTISNAKN